MKTEKTLAALLGVGLLLWIFRLPGSGTVTILSLGTLSLVYFPGAFYFLGEEGKIRKNLFLSVMAGMVFSPLALGILFKLMFWPKANGLLLSGLVPTLVMGAIILYYRQFTSADETVYYRRMVLRLAFLVGGALLLGMLPTRLLLEFHHPDDPAYVQLKMNALDNPNDQAANERLEHYVHQRDSLFLKRSLEEHRKH